MKVQLTHNKKPHGATSKFIVYEYSEQWICIPNPGETPLRAGELRSPCNPIGEEGAYMKTRNILLKVRVTEDKFEGLKSYAEQCGLTQ